MFRRLWAAFAALGLPFAMSTVEGGTGTISHLGLSNQPVAMPGVGQVVLVFIGVVSLALILAILLRRLSPALLGRLQGVSELPVVIHLRQRLEPGVHLHVVSIANQRFAIVTSRGAVALHELRGERIGLPVAPREPL
jgi:hypothetical protein